MQIIILDPYSDRAFIDKYVLLLMKFYSIRNVNYMLNTR